jgi:transposase
VLFLDETILRLFPPLRAKWAWRGSQAHVQVSGRNDRRVLYGAIDLHTGRRLLLRGKNMSQQYLHLFLDQVRRRCGKRPVWILLDSASSHTAARTEQLAQKLDLKFIWLPKQWPELNAMDHLWKDAKREILANRQYDNVDEQAARVEHYILELTPKQAKRKAGLLSENHWLKNVTPTAQPPSKKQ